MASIAELFVRVRGDTTDITRKLKSVEGSMNTFGQTANRVLGALGVSLSFAGFIRNSIEAQNAVAQLNAVVKSTGGAAGFTTPQLSAMAGQLQKVSTFSDEAIMGAQGLLLTFTKIRGDTLKGATQAVIDLATAMGGDLRGAAIQVGKALQDPAQGMTALRRVGVSFSAAQQEIIKNLFATGHAAEAQALILKELQKEFGGSALAARNTLGGALSALGNAFGDALEVSGNASIGIVGAINNIADAMPGAREAADSFFKNLTVGFGELAIAVTRANIYMARFQKSVGDFMQKIPGLKGIGKSESGAATAILGSDNGAGALLALERLRAEWILQAGSAGAAAGAHKNVARAIEDEIEPIKAISAGYMALREEADRVNKAIIQERTDWWKNYIEKTHDAISLTEKLREIHNQTLPSVEETLGGMMFPQIPEVSAPTVSLDDSVTKDQRKALEGLGIHVGDKLDTNTQKLHDAIWGSATQLANSIVGALNIGGGGKGSSLGSALGGSAGFAAGFFFGGPIGGAIGSTLGNIAGSLFGGLFDHKKAVNANTDAVNRNTAALLLNAPAGFRVGSYAYAATATGGADIEAYATAARRRAARGGTVPV